MNGFIIRIATPSDAEQLLEVYRPYVENTAISFEWVTPSVEEFRARIIKTLKSFPYLVAEENGEILGYAYTGPFVGRAAYAWSAETTIYLKASAKGRGIGRALYAELERISALQGYLNLNACIGVTDNPDEYLNNNSYEFHRHIGFTLVGRFKNSGCKFGRWYDMIWMEKLIGEHRENPSPVIPFSELKQP